MRVAPRLGLGLILSLAMGVAAAQDTSRFGLRPLWSPPGEAPANALGDPTAGREVAQGSAESGAWACVSCHGLQGEGDASGAFPRLSGLQPWYLYKQLQDYASGLRPHDQMSPIAARLTDRQRQDVAGWYAAQIPAPRGEQSAIDARVLQQGGAIAAVGAPDRGVTACSSCHGRSGEGSGPAIPALTGQYAPYMALQLNLWKQGALQRPARRDGAGRRRNDRCGNRCGGRRSMPALGPPETTGR